METEGRWVEHAAINRGTSVNSEEGRDISEMTCFDRIEYWQISLNLRNWSVRFQYFFIRWTTTHDGAVWHACSDTHLIES